MHREPMKGAIPRSDVYCAHCTAGSLPENAFMRGGKPFCDDWCADHYREFATTRTPEIVCPFCGYVYDESYELIGVEMVECENCMRRFELESEEFVEYTTNKPDWLRRWRAYNNVQVFRAEEMD